MKKLISVVCIMGLLVVGAFAVKKPILKGSFDLKGMVEIQCNQLEDTKIEIIIDRGLPSENIIASESFDLKDGSTATINYYVGGEMIPK